MALAHQFQWSEGDEICSGSYCSYYVWSWPDMRWIEIDMQLGSVNPGIRDDGDDDSAGGDDDSAGDDEALYATYAACKFVKGTLSSGSALHAPEWTETGGCRRCDLKPLQQSELAELAGKYDTTFNWN